MSSPQPEEVDIYLHCPNGRIIFWPSSQPTLSLSTTEAEYDATLARVRYVDDQVVFILGTCATPNSSSPPQPSE